MFLAQNIKYLREKSGEKQSDLAQALNVSESTMSKYENACIEPDLAKIILISQRYGVTLDGLILKDLRPPAPRYAENIKFLRKKYECSREDLANLLNVKQSTISFYEAGRKKMEVDDLLTVADYFMVTLEQLMRQDLSKDTKFKGKTG